MVTLTVCTTCRRMAGGEPSPDAPCPGTRLMEALVQQGLPDGIALRPVECLSACSQGSALALSGPGRWTYVYGRLAPDDAAQIIDGAARYAQTPDGIVPWRERPEIFRKQTIARIPPQE